MSITLIQKSIHALIVGSACWCAISSASAQSQPSSTITAVEAKTGPLSRAEVVADLRLWRRLGLDSYATHASYSVNLPLYDLALARYQALRSGPAFAAEVAEVLKGR